MNPAVWELSTTYHHVSFSCQINESQTIAIGIIVETVRADSAIEDALFPHFGIKVTNQDFNIVFGATVIRIIYLMVEGVFILIVCIFNRGMGTYQAYIEKSTFYSDGT